MSWELHAARKEIERLAVMTERLRIARDLHDLLGHNLFLIALKSELAGRLVGVAPERAAVEIGDVEQVARTTPQEVRAAVGNYRQPTLSSELKGAKEILAAAGIGYRYEASNRQPRAGVYDPGNERMATGLRRSQRQWCQQCAIACCEARGAASANGIGNGGHGLRGLAERVDALDGWFEAGPCVGGGFRLAVSVPLVQRAETPGTSTVSPERQTVNSSAVRLDPKHSGSPEERSEQRRFVSC